MRIAVLPLARTTFDIPLAEAKCAGMLAALRAAGHDLLGRATLLTDPDASRAALDDLARADADLVLVLQVTFTDAAFIVELAGRTDLPLAIWAPKEPRAGGRLRLNAFCGLNLAAHALARNGRRFSWLHADPDAPGLADDLAALLAGEPARPVPQAKPVAAHQGAGSAPLAGRHVVRIGAAPDGFDTCTYDADDVAQRFGARVTALELPQLFNLARAIPDTEVAALRDEMAETTDGLAALDAGQLDRSLRLRLALDRLQATEAADAFAIRCWPETFTEYGGAVCGPVSMLGEARIPCACEADLWGALTQMLLQDVAQAPVFLADLVDMDTADDTGVVWHCGQAPRSMAAGAVSGTVHTNRKQPLLFEFTLRPGRVTFLRLSQSAAGPRLVVAGGEMLARPMAFTGTSGVVRFDAPVAAVTRRILDAGLEHHMALAYGDHRAALVAAAARLGLPVLDLTGDGDGDGREDAA